MHGKKMALVDYSRCRPQQCVICPAMKACPHKLIKQEAGGGIPMTDPALCRGCGDCVRACPLKALAIYNQ